MYEDIKKYVQNYYKLKGTIVGNLTVDAYKHRLRDYFDKTYGGEQLYQYHLKKMTEEINQRKKSLINLKCERQDMHFRWRKIERLPKGYRMELTIDRRIKYKGIGVESSIKGEWHTLEVIKGNKGLLIEKEYSKEKTRDKWDKNNRLEPHARRAKLPRMHYFKEVQVRRPYQRIEAVAYAKQYALHPNKRWGNYEPYGGDCTNFTAQCLYAGGIPFDETNQDILKQWYWHTDKHRVPSWTGADFFKTYLLENGNKGICCRLVKKEELEIGDLVQLGDLKKTTHTMIVVGKVHQKVGEEEVVELLIAQHSTGEEGRGYNIPLSTKPEPQLYYKILGYNH